MFKQITVFVDYLRIFKIRHSQVIENLFPEKLGRDLLEFDHLKKWYKGEIGKNLIANNIMKNKYFSQFLNFYIKNNVFYFIRSYK